MLNGSEATLRETRASYARKYQRAKRAAFRHYSNGRLEDSLEFAFAAARFAYRYHLGFWYDSDVERLLSLISSSILNRAPRPDSSRSTQESPRIVFVATFLANVGGHSEVLRLWLRMLSWKQKTRPYVITTFPVHSEFPFKKTAECTYLSLEDITLVGKVRSLVHRVLEINPGVIVLFINPHDVVAITALHYIRKKLDAEVVFYNHADHAFWLGRDVIDALVVFSPVHAHMARELRDYDGRILVVPFTTDVGERSLTDGKGRVGPQRHTMSVSVGSPWKIVPDGHWNYLQTIKTILESSPDHRHVLVTRPSKLIAQALKGWQDELRDRLTIEYQRDDPLDSYLQSDFVIETFPFAGGQVRIEAMAMGKPVIFIHNPRFPPTFFHSDVDHLANDYPFIARSNEEVVTHARVLIEDGYLRDRAGGDLAAFFERRFSMESIALKLDSLVGMDWDSISVDPRLSGSVNGTAIDSDYLFSVDLKVNSASSPYLTVIRNLVRKRAISVPTLLESLRCLQLEDWRWLAGYMKNRVWRWLRRAGA